MTAFKVLGMVVATAVIVSGRGLNAQPAASFSFEIVATSVIDRNLFITVRNTGTLSITAWGARGSMTFEGGRHQEIGFTIDGYAHGFVDPRQQGERAFFQLTPNTTLVVRSGAVLPDAPMLSAALAPNLVVFADGSALGNERLIEMIFVNRARERRAAQLIENVMGRYLGTVSDPATAVALIDRELQDLADDEIRQATPYKALRLNLSVALKEAERSPIERGQPPAIFLTARLQTLQTRNRAWRIAGDAHSVRR